MEATLSGGGRKEGTQDSRQGGRGGAGYLANWVGWKRGSGMNIRQRKTEDMEW